jgi:tetratricopeptide (TPR) repeat protein
VHYKSQHQKTARDQFEYARRAHDMLKRRAGGSTFAGIQWVDGVPRRQSPYEHSIEELRQLVRVNPRHEALNYNLAWKYYEAGRLDEALLQFERVLEINPRNTDAEHNLKAVKLQKVIFKP